MTALKGFERLEASGIWRAGVDAQRRDVIVSFGKATLVLTDMQDRPLAHWSLPAVARANPGELPALYHPDGDPGETLELAADETVMIDAIERVRQAVHRRRPHPGRLRRGIGFGIAAALVALAIFWLPGAVTRHAVSVVPDVKRAQIGHALAARLTRVAGPACQTPRGSVALDRLMSRLGTGAGRLRRARVVPGGIERAVHLPGGTVLLSRTLVEDYETPEVAAGYILTEAQRSQEVDPLAALLKASGPFAGLRLLTTGDFPEGSLDTYAQALMTERRAPVDEAALLRRFETAGISTKPFAYARDVSGEAVLGLIEADPMTGKTPEPILSDGDWLSLQAICEG
ncbi:hypothetical protein SAMN05421688_2037 [Poseidonocella pacifica]|uniref:Uncharacterized protein n=1 Tax=Poseidonocella pacifica TaxID=871651 RepID=A0A1I0XBV6_9RHOB|nr:hypothetical protein [Poseidonocella pacifica]SFA97830.1 hypothetical protein SAMN05421688_2037 [Poseidonocella pacifica]